MSRNDTSTPSPAVSWECIEAFARGKVQQFVEHLLEEELTALLERGCSERRAAVDAPAGYRNGFGKPRRLAMQSGTITLRRPRLRGLEARFESKILPLFARRTKELGALLPELYLHGLSLGDFRARATRPVRRGRPALGLFHRAPQGGLADRLRRLENARSFGPRTGVPLG
ncbi:MAG: transposase [Chloroflexota bacterium]|nr:transposase [Chloroflexota bacterium]